MLNKKLLGSVSSLPSDDNFENVSLLLSGDGTNGAQNNTFLDSSTNNFTITRNGNTTQGSFSPYGSLWSNYITTSNYLTAPANAAFQMGSGDFTIEAWIFPTATAGSSNSEILSYGAPNEFDGWHLYQVSSTNVLSFGLNYAGLIVSSSAALTLNQWTHVAVTRSGTTFKLWINGVNDGTATSSTSQSTNASDKLYVGTGSYSQGADRSFNGYISNARVVKGSVVYSATFTPSTIPLTAITNTSVLTCQSNRFIDNSSNNFTITASGSPSVQRFSPFNPTAPYSTSVIGGSGYFDGSGDYLSVASNAALGFGTGDFSVAFWAYLPSASTTQVLFDNRISTGVGLVIFSNSGTLTVIFNNAGSVLITGGTLVSNQWNYIVLSRVSSNTRLFLNGSQSGSTASDTNNYPANPTYIASSFGLDTFATGYVSDLRIVKGSGVTSVTLPTAPLTAITDTQLLANFTNAGIPDLAMQNNLETVGNAQVSTSVKKYGTGSLAFDGTGDYLLSAATQVIAASRFTVEAWLYKSSTNEKYAIAQGTSGNAGRFAIGVAGTNWFVQIGSANVNAGSVSTNTWTHIAVTYDGATLTLYVNGTSVGTASTTQAVQNTTLRLGTLGPSWSDIYEWDGYMDDIRITNGVIRYTTTFTPPASALPSF